MIDTQNGRILIQTLFIKLDIAFEKNSGYNKEDPYRVHDWVAENF